MRFNQNFRLENYILSSKWEDLPYRIQERAVCCGIDLFGALILGSHGKQFAVGEKIAQMMGFGSIPILGSRNCYSLLGASSAMGHAANSFDIDDGYNMIKGHPGSSFVAGVLSAALYKNCTYRDYLTTLSICYEVTIRWALAMQDHYNFLHSTGSYGAFGTAAGVGRLIGLSREQLNNALSMADFHAPMTPVMRSVEYPSMNKDGVPFGAMIGTLAVLETISGESATGHLLEMPEYEKYLDSLGKRFYIEELYFKPYTCCRWAHQPISACLALMRENDICAEQIENVIVRTFAAAAALSKKKPRNTDEAQYNVAFPVASALVNGDLGYRQICDEALNDSAVMDMMNKLDFIIDPEMESLFPEKRMCRVEIFLKNGQKYHSDAYEAPGEHDDPALDKKWITDKFKKITSPFFTGIQADQLLDLLQNGFEIPVQSIVETINDMLSVDGKR